MGFSSPEKRNVYYKQWECGRQEAGLCVDCGKARDDPKLKWKCRACQDRYNKMHTRLRQAKRDKGLCVHCGAKLDSSSSWACASCLQTAAENSRKNRPQQRQELKDEVFRAYGGQCACCNEDEPLFLTIDHINGDGAAHRREVGTQGGTHFYSWLKREGYPSGYQILCYNCNAGRYQNGGVCPHKKEHNVRAIS